MISFRSNRYGISKNESGIGEISIESGVVGLTSSETSVVGVDFCVAPSETLIPVRTGTIYGVAHLELGISPSESGTLSLGTSSGIISSDPNLFESVLFLSDLFTGTDSVMI